MREYSNLPVLSWRHDPDAAYKAKAQIMRQEPVVVEMPEIMRYDLCAAEFECRYDSESGQLEDCDAGAALEAIAVHNGMPLLSMLSEAAERSGTRLDIHPELHHFILHA